MEIFNQNMLDSIAGDYFSVSLVNRTPGGQKGIMAFDITVSRRISGMRRYEVVRVTPEFVSDIECYEAAITGMFNKKFNKVVQSCKDKIK